MPTGNVTQYVTLSRSNANVEDTGEGGGMLSTMSTPVIECLPYCNILHDLGTW